MMARSPLHWLTEKLLSHARRPAVIRLRRLFGPLPNKRQEAEEFGRKRLIPVLGYGREVVLDFAGVGLITQGFFHALLDEAITRDVRWATRIRLANASKPQTAVFDLAMRYMVDTANGKIRSVAPTVSREGAHAR